MARLGLDENQKFKRLALALNPLCCGMGRHLARGILEALWNGAYERADDFLGDSDDVEIAADWKGERGALTKLLEHVPAGKAAGLIEYDDERGGYNVHDFEVHAPAWVKLKITTAAAREAAGKTLSDVRREAGRRGAFARKHSKNKQTVSDLPAIDKQDANQLTAKNDNGKGREGTGRDGKDTHFARACDPAATMQSAVPVPREEPTTLRKPAVWRAGMESRWSKLAGVPGFSFPGIVDLADLVDKASAQTERDAGELFDLAVAKFHEYRAGCSKGRAPQLTPLGLIAKWSEVWQLIAGTAPLGKEAAPITRASKNPTTLTTGVGDRF